MNRILFSILLPGFLAACSPVEPEADAYGYFEAREIIVSAEQAGRLLRFTPREGESLQAGQEVGLIDTMPLYLQRKQVEARMEAVLEKTRDAGPQIAVLERERSGLVREQERLQRLLAEEAATPQQLDQMETKLAVVQERIRAAEADMEQLNRGVLAELKPLRAQLAVLDDQLSRCRIRNPVPGTVLLRLAEAGELVGPNRMLYRLAPLEELELRVYLTGSQLSGVQLGETVQVLIDENAERTRRLEGVISWISAEAEFTPKNVQTREDAVGLVYAVKVRVPNDGRLRIGMPGKIRLAGVASSTAQSD